MPTADPNQLPTEAHHTGHRTLRRYHEASLGYFERRAEVKFVLESASGCLVLPVEPGFAKAGVGELAEFVLFAPHENAWVIQLSLEPKLIARPEAEEACDRWRGYHGQTTATHWLRCSIQGGKTESGVFDPEQLQLPNALGRAEYALIKHANADLVALANACKAHAAMLVADPQCVGIDPFGMDVRARFGILRLEFPPGIDAATPDAAKREIDRLLARTL